MNDPLGEVNRNIRDLAAKLDPRDSSSWEFVCECGDDRCNERLRLALARYDELRSTQVALLAPGHTPRRLA